MNCAVPSRARSRWCRKRDRIPCFQPCWPHLSSSSSSKNFRPDAAFDLAVRDVRTGLTFFNVEGHQYDYDAKTQSLNIQGGRLLISNEFAKALGRPSDAGANVGRISIGAAMQPIEVTTACQWRTQIGRDATAGGATQGDVPTRTIPGPMSL